MSRSGFAVAVTVFLLLNGFSPSDAGCKLLDKATEPQEDNMTQPVPVAPSTARKAWRGFLAGITSTDAVKLEKSLVVLVVTRVLISLGASAGVVDLITRVFG